MRKSRLSLYKQERLLELFISGSTSRTAADLVGVHRNSAAYYFHHLRILIMEAVKLYLLVELNEMSVILEDIGRGKEVGGMRAKCRYLGFKAC